MKNKEMSISLLFSAKRIAKIPDIKATQNKFKSGLWHLQKRLNAYRPNCVTGTKERYEILLQRPRPYCIIISYVAYVGLNEVHQST